MVPSPPASRALVSTEWLAERLGRADVVVVDASYYLPNINRDAKSEYQAGHIPGAVFFDIDAIADHSSDLPHMLPGPGQFAKEAGALGISNDDTIVVYDALGLFSAPRVWWTFRIFGADNAFILDGGLAKWKAEQRPLEAKAVKHAPREFKAQMNTGAVALQSDVQVALNNRGVQIVDARPADRFRGQAPEPRPGLRSGHIPGAFNVPATTLVEGGRLVAPERLRQAFVDAGVDLDQPIITS
jgi:thiosulfate/3-mercaptopyruvate sulfurtransferase